MLGRAAAVVVAVLLSSPLSLGLSACGSGTGQLQVTLGSPDAGNSKSGYTDGDPTTYARYKPGESARLIVTVVNTGPGTVTGVTIHVVLPGSFHYRATTSIVAPGATRTQPLDAAVNSNAPIFGLWTIAPPGAAGPGKASKVEVTFTADVSGSPGDEVVQGFAAGDASSGQTNAQPYSVSVDPAAKLSALVTVNPGTVKRGGTVTYDVRITNSGTGNAAGVAVLITLPPVMTFVSSVTPFAGNGSRNKGVDPIKNTLVVFYDGFLLPPTSAQGPGFVVVRFKATVAGASRGAFATPSPSTNDGGPSSSPSAVATPTGTYTVDAQVTDDGGDTFTLHDVAPVSVT